MVCSFVEVQDVVPITSCDTAGSFLLLGCNNGSIYYIGAALCTHTHTHTWTPGLSVVVVLSVSSQICRSFL